MCVLHDWRHTQHILIRGDWWVMAKSDCGLPANSKATPLATSQEEESLRWQLATGEITLREFGERYGVLKRQGKIYRRF